MQLAAYHRKMKSRWRGQLLGLGATLSLTLLSGMAQPTGQTADPNGGLGVERPTQRAKGGGQGNKPDREQWFMDLGFCMYVSWSLDCQLGTVISHSLAGASDDYIERFFNDLPKTFNPKHFDAESLVRLAKVSGAKYLMFTPKYHSGFCMFDTKTTPFSIMNTPYGKDITRMIADECHRQGVALGFYFSPDDFWFIHKQALEITRGRPEVKPRNNPQLMEYNKQQLRELLTNYGKVDTLYFDGDTSGLKKLAWELQPDLLITRGYMNTPEQAIPVNVMAGPWETAFVMGTQWAFKPTNERFKTGTELIHMLIEVRAKGGNLALDVGPDPAGDLQREQERLFMEIGLWNFINQEAVYKIRPCVVPNEGDVWFTGAKDGSAVFAILTKQVWPYGRWQTLTLKKVRATDKTEIEILGQSGRVMEYGTNTVPKTT